MQMKKEKIALTAVLAILLSMFINMIAVFAVSEPTITLEDVDSINTKQIKEGDEFQINVKFSNPNGYKSLSGAINYDATKLELIPTEYDEVLSVIQVAENGDKKVGYDMSGNVIMIQESKNEETNDYDGKIIFTFNTDKKNGLKAGTIAFLKFRVKDNATGNFQISVSNVQYLDDANKEQPAKANVVLPNTITKNIYSVAKTITANKSNITLGYSLTKQDSENLTLSFNNIATENLTWSANPTGIVNVEQDNQNKSNVKITATAVGTTEITGTSATAGVEPVKINVTVVDKSLKEINLSETNNIELDLSGDKTKAIVVSFTPDDTYDAKEIEWTSSDTSKVTVTPDSNNSAKATINAVEVTRNTCNNNSNF